MTEINPTVTCYFWYFFIYWTTVPCLLDLTISYSMFLLKKCGLKCKVIPVFMPMFLGLCFQVLKAFKLVLQ